MLCLECDQNPWKSGLFYKNHQSKAMQSLKMTNHPKPANKQNEVQIRNKKVF